MLRMIATARRIDEDIRSQTTGLRGCFSCSFCLWGSPFQVRLNYSKTGCQTSSVYVKAPPEKHPSQPVSRVYPSKRLISYLVFVLQAAEPSFLESTQYVGYTGGGVWGPPEEEFCHEFCRGRDGARPSEYTRRCALDEPMSLRVPIE